MNVLGFYLSLFVTLAIYMNPVQARLLEQFPAENLILKCQNESPRKTVVEVYDLFGNGRLVAAFIDDHDNVATLPVTIDETGFRSKKGSAFFNLYLIHLGSSQYLFSVFEADLSGNGKVVVSPIELACTNLKKE